MSSFGFRPHFTLRVVGSPDQARERLVQALKGCCEGFEIRSFPGFVCLRIPAAERHFWSPRLHLSFDPDGAEQTSIEGIYGPNASLWSLFVYGYLILGSAALFGGSLGFAQRVLGTPAWGLWILSIALGLGVGLWVMAQLGQRLGAAQTARLQRLIDQALQRG